MTLTKLFREVFPSRLKSIRISIVLKKKYPYPSDPAEREEMFSNPIRQLFDWAYGEVAVSYMYPEDEEVKKHLYGFDIILASGEKISKKKYTDYMDKETIPNLVRLLGHHLGEEYEIEVYDLGGKKKLFDIVVPELVENYKNNKNKVTIWDNSK